MKTSLTSLAVLAGALVLTAPAIGQDLPSVSVLGMTVPNYDAMAGAKMGISGLFERKVGLDNRTAKLYVPEDTRLGTSIVVLNVPEGQETVQWLSDSGWLAVADARKILLYVFEAAPDGTWGSVEDEREYFETAYANISQSIPEGRGIYYLPPESYYVVGYDAPGTLLHELAMKDPTLVASAAFIDASDMPASVLEAMDETIYSTPDWNGEDVAASDVPMPVLLVESEESSANAEAVAAYWMETNEVGSEGQAVEGGTTYTQEDGTLEYFVADSSRVEVTVLENQDRAADGWGAPAIYDGFLAKYTRYGGAAGGNTVGFRPDYESLGVETKTMELDGRLREYLVYVPEAVKASGEPAPVVYALHGSGMTMTAMFDYSRWWEVADAEGFVLVVPMGFNMGNRTGWDVSAGGPDVAYIGALVDQIIDDYNIDESRMYVSGQSNGSRMTHTIGQDPELSKRFAAMGSTSGRAVESDTTEPVVPYHLLWGEFDSWPWQMDAENVGFTLNYWLDRNQATTAATEPQSEVTEGRFRTYGWANAEGQDVVRYTVTMGRGHSIIPAEMTILWDWFSSWEKNADGVSVFVGE